MKKKELKNYIQKKEPELVKEIDDLKKEFLKAKLSIITGREKDLKKAKNINKKIAQLKTLLRYKDFVKLVKKDGENKNN